MIDYKYLSMFFSRKRFLEKNKHTSITHILSLRLCLHSASHIPRCHRYLRESTGARDNKILSFPEYFIPIKTHQTPRGTDQTTTPRNGNTASGTPPTGTPP